MKSMVKKSMTILLALAGMVSTVQSGTGTLDTIVSEKERIIFDTDMGPDYDDVGALAILHVLADRGYADILATVSSNSMEKTVQLIHCLNTYYGRPDLPIGVVKENGLRIDTWHKGRKWTDELLKKYPYNHPIASETEDAVFTYRKALAAQPDNSVTVITVGFLTNLANLLHSAPDSISPFTGVELVQMKVKRLVSMAGRFPEGREYNVYAEVKSAKQVIGGWPTEIVFSGAEIGRYIRTGDKLIASKIPDNPVKYAYELAIPQDMLEFDNSRYEMGGRASYDQTAVLAGVMGVNLYFNHERGRLTLQEDGSNTWQADEQGQHIRLMHRHSFQYMADLIEELMMARPDYKKENLN